ncbi:MAG: hypothetical protein ABI414_07625, partial [Devosia sp.]
RYVSVAGRRGIWASFLRYMTGAVAVPLLLVAAISVFIFPLSLSLGEGLVLPGSTLVAGLILGCAIGASVTVAEVDNSDGHWLRSALQYLAPALAQIGGALVAGLLGRGAVFAAFVAAGLLVPVVGVHLLLQRRGTKALAPEQSGASAAATIGELMVFALPMLVWILPAIINRVADRWLLAAASDVRALAAFAVIAALTQNVMAAIYTVMNRVWLPQIFSQAADGLSPEGLAEAHRRVALLTLLLVGAGGVLVACYAIGGGWILGLLAGPELVPFAPLMVTMGLGATLQAVGDAQLLHGQIERRLGVYTAFRMVVPAVYIGAGLLLVTTYSASGMAWAYLTAALVGGVVCLATNRICFGSVFFLGPASPSKVT